MVNPKGRALSISDQLVVFGSERVFRPVRGLVLLRKSLLTSGIFIAKSYFTPLFLEN